VGTIPEILQLLRENRFDAAIPLVIETLESAAAESPQKLTDAARDLVRFQGFFRNNAEAMTSESYFRTVHRILAELAGPESPAAMAAAENLAGLLGSIGKVDEAIVLREKVLAHLSNRLPGDDSRVMTVRDGLSVLYQRAGREDELSRLYQDTGLCEHLRAAEIYVREHGGRVVSSGRPWSANCHVWVYFDTLLDCDRLVEGLGLASCVQVHDHRGTHDGSERGIVCTVHHDGIIGPHPADASPGVKTVTVPGGEG
jgi:hypothetical protein